MQNILTFKVDKKEYSSKPFDFEAMCIINDAQNTVGKNGPMSICRDAVDYMFEGTEATQTIIDGLDNGTRAKLCLDLWGMYTDALTVKND